MQTPEEKKFEKWWFAVFVLVVVHGCQVSSSINNLASAVEKLSVQKPAATQPAPTQAPAKN